MTIILSLALWYGSAALTLAVLVRRGHSATPWTVAAVLLGGLLPILAVVVRWRILRSDAPTVRVAADRVAPARHPDPAGMKLLALGRPADLAGAVGEVPVPMASRVASVDLAGVVGYEAMIGPVDTGEVGHALRDLRSTRPLAGLDARLLVTGGLPDALERAMTGTGRPDLVVVPVGARPRRTAADAVAAARRSRLPILMTPLGRPVAAPANRPAEARA